MKVVHIVESTATGTLSMVRLLSRRQAEIGIEVCVVYSRRPETPPNLERSFHEGVTLKNIQMTGARTILPSLFELRGLLKELRPDVVFLHSSFAGFVGRLSGIFISSRFFYIPHSISFMMVGLAFWKKFIFIFLEWIAAVKDCEYIACSSSEKRVIEKYVPFRRCRLIENAVDISKWNSGECAEWTNRDNIVVTVGQIRDQKNPLYFAKIAKEVLSRNPSFKFIWVGDGDQVMREHLSDSGVEVVGWKSPEEVREFLFMSRFYLSTSKWEGMPVSPIEAMLAGNVALLSDSPGNVDVIRSGLTGYIFGSDKECTEKLLSLNEDNWASSKLVEAARTYCSEKYNSERYFSDFETLLKRA